MIWVLVWFLTSQAPCSDGRNYTEAQVAFFNSEEDLNARYMKLSSLEKESAREFRSTELEAKNIFVEKSQEAQK